MTPSVSTSEPLRGDAPRIDPASTPGFSDALGDRRLTFDLGSATWLEALHFRPEFSVSAVFRRALLERVEQLGRLRHPGIAAVRHVGGLAAGERLTLVSTHTAGRRLSDLLDKAGGWVFALELIHNVTASLAALQAAGPGSAHGALTADRIVVTREGLVLVEYVVGAALHAMRLPAARLRSEFGLLAADEGAPTFDARADVVQLGYLALSLLLGRRLDPSRDTDLAALLDDFIDQQATGAPNASRLRRWLERALQLDAPFESAASAQLALGDLPDEIETEIPRPVRVAAAPRTFAAPTDAATRDAMPDTASHDTAADAAIPETLAPSRPEGALPKSSPRRRGGLVQVTVFLAVVAIAEAVAIVGLLGTRQAPMVVELRPPGLVPAAPAALPVPQANAPAAATAASGPLVDPAAPGSVGGISVSSAIELRVLEQGTELGSSGGPIALADGTHQLDLVNDELGFTVHQTVAVTAGQMTPVKIAVPNGRLSINAVPWADVWIDGTAAGQTPLANLSIPIGKHDILFRHPKLGEQHQTAIVKVDGQTRVSATFQK
jgi:hypothetical protein